MNSSEIISSVKRAAESLDELKTVCICNPITLKNIKMGIDIPPNLVFVEDTRVEENTLLVAKNPELKKALLEIHYRNELEKNARLKIANQKEGE